MKFPTAFLSLIFTCLLMTACRGDAATDEGATSGRKPGAPAASETMAAPVAAGASDYVPAGYELVWNDEFDYTGLPDTTRWGFQKGGFGWTAKELQYYSDGELKNSKVEGGMLHITALKEKIDRNEFSSARLVTKKKATFEQGYFEVRAKFPAGEGLRSAVWMVGDTVSKIGWPNAGEIDIVEHYGKVPDYIGGAVQTQADSWNRKGQKGGAVQLPTATSEFHVYAVQWTDEQLVFSLDGEPYLTYPRPTVVPGTLERGWPFKWPFYLAMNLSVGGVRGRQSNNISDNIFPAEMLVDYVRVYQR